MSVRTSPYTRNRKRFGILCHSSKALKMKRLQMKASKLSLTANSSLLVLLKNAARLMSNEKPVIYDKWATRKAPVPTIKKNSVFAIKRMSPIRLNKKPT